VWYSFGQFCLRAAVYEGPTSPKFSDLRGKAVEALTEAYALNTSNAEVLKMLGAILLEQGRYEKAAEVLYDALDLETPSIGKRRRSVSGEEEVVRTLAQAAEPEPLTSILMCLYFTTIGNYVSAGEYLGHAVRAYKERGLQAPGKPRRTGSLLALQAAEFLVNAALPGLATRALDLAAKCEAASIAKAAGIVKTKPTPGNAAARIAAAKLAQIEAIEKVLENGGEGAEPACIVQQRLRVSVKIALLNRDHVAALPLALEATKHDPKDSESWSLLGDAQYGAGVGQWEEAAFAYNKAIDLINKETPPTPPPLRLLVRLGSLYLNLNRFEDAKNIYLMGAGSWQTCSMWLGVGISLLRLEQFGEAETALQEANIRNNRSGAVWGYMCLLCLNSGSTRLTQADHAREVAERLSLEDATLLRELGNAYTSLDRLETAEGLYRRSLAVDEGNSHTRRRLADVLSAQNAVADAVNEYFRVIDSCKEKYSNPQQREKLSDDDKKECLFAISQCKKLLKTLGRAEEFESLRQLRSALTEN
jgi:tetratricopeptide (TPR) repeat protein